MSAMKNIARYGLEILYAVHAFLLDGSLTNLMFAQIIRLPPRSAMEMYVNPCPPMKNNKTEDVTSINVFNNMVMLALLALTRLGSIGIFALAYSSLIFSARAQK